jgi:hypothetical protein
VLRRQLTGRAQRLQRVPVAAGVVERDAPDAEDPGAPKGSKKSRSPKL